MANGNSSISGEELRVNFDDLTTKDGYSFDYEDAPFTGIAYSLNEDTEALEEETAYVNGGATGPTRSWFAPGQLSQEGLNQNNQPVGLWRWWYENGQLAREATYDAAHQLQSNQEWYEDGSPVPGSAEVTEEEDSYQRRQWQVKIEAMGGV